MSVVTQIEESTRPQGTRVASLKDVQAAGCLVIKGPDRPIALFYHEGMVRAVDNRCPHMGFPLHKGPVKDGILICPWHHARFDLTSGCTFDLFADDVPAYPVEVSGDDVMLHIPPVGDSVGRAFRRLRTGMENNVGLVTAKSVIALLKEDVAPDDIVREAALFGATNRDGWGSGLVILGAMANIAPKLPADHAALALAHGITAAARDTAGMAPRRPRWPLDRPDLDHETARRWFRHWVLARHRDGAERTLLTALASGCRPVEAADIIFTAITDRFYSDAGHTLDFANKAFQIVDRVGWDHAQELLPALVPIIVGARGAEESSPWRSPIDLVALLQEAFTRIPAAAAEGSGKEWNGEQVLATRLLGDEPALIIESLLEALRLGAGPAQLGRSLSLAAATRIARFGTANEFGDWDTALHTFTYANALDEVLQRCPSLEVLRGVFHGAMSVYMDRFLNIPPAPLPAVEGAPGEVAPGVILDDLLERLNRQQQVGEAAQLVNQYLQADLPHEPLLATLAYATLREDAAFHTFQMLEASLQQYHHWSTNGATPQSESALPPQNLILIALARYLAAHSPTQRSFLQTFDIARRLHRGDTLYEE